MCDSPISCGRTSTLYGHALPCGVAYRELRTPQPLTRLVECGWVDTAATDGVHAVLPDGCMDLVWTGSELLVAGPDTVARPAPRERGVTTAGLRFAPGALPSLLKVPAVELHNRQVALVDVVQAPACAAIARLEAGDAALPVLAALTARLPGTPPDASVAALRSALAPETSHPGAAAARFGGQSPLESVTALADMLGCTTRSVHRRCLSAFGYGPAVLRRVLRFRRATALLHAGMAPADVAAMAGYADQPHLSREVRALAGASPCQLASGANRSTLLPSGSWTAA
jgi:AraC-like DNA-binding protein